MDKWRENFKTLRKNQNITQSDIASYLNKGQQAIAWWEKGKGEPSIKEIDLLTKLFGVSANEFLYGTHLKEKKEGKKDKKNAHLNAHPNAHPNPEISTQGSVNNPTETRIKGYYSDVDLETFAAEDIDLLKDDSQPDIETLKAVQTRFNARLKKVEEQIKQLLEKNKP